jgi:hypothetical protein
MVSYVIMDNVLNCAHGHFNPIKTKQNVNLFLFHVIMSAISKITMCVISEVVNSESALLELSYIWAQYVW